MTRLVRFATFADEDDYFSSFLDDIGRVTALRYVPTDGA